MNGKLLDRQVAGEGVGFQVELIQAGHACAVDREAFNGDGLDHMLVGEAPDIVPTDWAIHDDIPEDYASDGAEVWTRGVGVRRNLQSDQRLHRALHADLLEHHIADGGPTGMPRPANAPRRRREPLATRRPPAGPAHDSGRQAWRAGESPPSRDTLGLRQQTFADSKAGTSTCFRLHRKAWHRGVGFGKLSPVP